MINNYEFMSIFMYISINYCLLVYRKDVKNYSFQESVNNLFISATILIIYTYNFQYNYNYIFATIKNNKFNIKISNNKNNNNHS